MKNSISETADEPSPDQANNAEYVTRLEDKILELANEVLRLKKRLSRMEGMRK